LFSESGPPGEAELRALYEATAPLLVRIAARIAGSAEAAEDIVHESFIKLLEKRIPFPSADDARYWLIRVVKNGALNHAKRRGRESRAYERWWRGERQESESADKVALAADEAERTRRHLAELPEKLRSVLVLKEYGGMSYKEIGRILGISEGNVKVRAFRAREALLARFEQEGKHVP
jgi:RNA polymerase sigma-70 factor (ECF subfamily)